MLKIAAFFLFVFLFIPINAVASEAFVITTNGKTVSVEVTINDINPTKKELHLRDNNYQLLKTYTLNQQDNKYTQSFPAPEKSGLYTLEARIEGNGFANAYVETLQIGSAADVNSNVNVNVNVQGTKNQTQQQSQGQAATPTPTAEPTPEISQTIVGSQIDFSESDQGFFAKVKNFFMAIWNFSLRS